MLELIDQSTPDNLKYRCPLCYVVGTSTPVLAPDNAFIVPTPGAAKPYGIVRHQCDPALLAARRAPPAPAEPATEPTKPRGRPRKSAAIPKA